MAAPRRTPKPQPKPTCSFEGCDKRVFGHGLCQGHARQRRLGQELRSLRPPRPTAAEGYHWCSRCKQFRPEEDFGWDKTRQQWKRVCLDCAKDGQKAYADRNREKVSLGRQLSKWGITRDQYQSLVQAQGGRCAICGSTETRDKRNGRWNVDHDHATGRIRGLLCALCNRGLGQLRDDPDLLRAALAYLDNPPAQGVIDGS